MRVRVLGLEEDTCVFEYSSEIEGGYVRYRCSASTSDSMVVVEVVTRPDVGDYGSRSWPRESFNVKDCELVESGSLWMEADQRPIWRSKYINKKFNIFSIDEILGSGAFPQHGSTVKITYRVLGGSAFDDSPPDSSQLARIAQFTLGSDEVGGGLETAVDGMRVGGQRAASMRRETVAGIELGEASDSTVVTFWIELLSVE
jgi:hypothetical protein